MYAFMIQECNISMKMMEHINASGLIVGEQAPYYRYTTFPTELNFTIPISGNEIESFYTKE